MWPSGSHSSPPAQDVDATSRSGSSAPTCPDETYRGEGRCRQVEAGGWNTATFTSSESLEWAGDGDLISNGREDLGSPVTVYMDMGARIERELRQFLLTCRQRAGAIAR